jgi:hypothetical protein
MHIAISATDASEHVERLSRQRKSKTGAVPGGVVLDSLASMVGVDLSLQSDSGPTPSFGPITWHGAFTDRYSSM